MRVCRSVPPSICERALTVRVDGVLRAGRRGGLRAVTAGAVQRVPAAPRGVGVQRSQRQGQLIPGRAGLMETAPVQIRSGAFRMTFQNVGVAASYLPRRRHGAGSFSRQRVAVVCGGQQSVLGPPRSHLIGGRHGFLPQTNGVDQTTMGSINVHLERQPGTARRERSDPPSKTK